MSPPSHIAACNPATACSVETGQRRIKKIDPASAGEPVPTLALRDLVPQIGQGDVGAVPLEQRRLAVLLADRSGST